MGIGPRLVEKRRSSCMVIINNKLARLLFPPSVLHLRRAQWSKRITKSRQWICFEAESVIPNSSSSMNLQKATTGLKFWTSSHTVNVSPFYSTKSKIDEITLPISHISKLKFMISSSVTEACNNSILLLGPRGSGKNAVCSSLASTSFLRVYSIFFSQCILLLGFGTCHSRFAARISGLDLSGIHCLQIIIIIISYGIGSVFVLSIELYFLRRWGWTGFYIVMTSLRSRLAFLKPACTVTNWNSHDVINLLLSFIFFFLIV